MKTIKLVPTSEMGFIKHSRSQLWIRIIYLLKFYVSDYYLWDIKTCNIVLWNQKYKANVT